VAQSGRCARRRRTSWSSSVSTAALVGGTPPAGAGRLAVGEWLRTDGAHAQALPSPTSDNSRSTRARAPRRPAPAVMSSRWRRHRARDDSGAAGPVRRRDAGLDRGRFGCGTPFQWITRGGTIDVEAGWVGSHKAASAHPGGCAVPDAPKVGPTPLYADLTAGRCGRDNLTSARQARRRDARVWRRSSGSADNHAMTLWHLLSRMPAEDRGVVPDALATSRRRRAEDPRRIFVARLRDARSLVGCTDSAPRVVADRNGSGARGISVCAGVLQCCSAGCWVQQCWCSTAARQNRQHRSCALTSPTRSRPVGELTEAPGGRDDSTPSLD
jgi:hypothetical protein